MSYRLVSGMDDLRDTLMAYGCIALHAATPASLFDFLDRESGTRLHVAWPEGAMIQLRPRTLLGHFSPKYYDVCLQGKYVCCEEAMEPFGVVELTKIGSYQLIMMIGRSGAVYCYEEMEKCVSCLAPDMKAFMKLGLRHCEYLHKEETYQCPLITYDDEIIKRLLKFDWEEDQLSGILNKDNHTIYKINDPTGEQVDTHFALWSSDSNIIKFKDTCFSVMRPEGFRSFEIMVRCVPRLVCMNQLLGALGCILESGEFLVRLYVLADKFGVIYGFDPFINGIYRLADTFRMFTCVMGQKGHQNHRYDRKRAGTVRLEKIPYCLHGREPVDPMNMFNDDDDDESEQAPKTTAEVVERIHASIRGHLQFCVTSVMLDSPASGRLWPQELEALSDSLILQSLPYDADEVRCKLLGGIADMRAFEMSFVGTAEDDDSDREETVRGYLFDESVCERCVANRRLRLFRAGRGSQRGNRSRVSYV
ncbi:tegument protein vICA [Cercopithecine betaherpesvirus 5]|uniref:Tegument protein vICA n=1 Tax=Simian cytomegalovirus (strain Colburn) TaxID=50292 RepID=G8XTA8_SCMVC|nr:tegument protein vICA [Cercopithecine betaherpesvirus 5]AEV80401.1 tegument protein vICA [Cercopithecine betaherpesvirus 5]